MHETERKKLLFDKILSCHFKLFCSFWVRAVAWAATPFKSYLAKLVTVNFLFGPIATRRFKRRQWFSNIWGPLMRLCLASLNFGRFQLNCHCTLSRSARPYTVPWPLAPLRSPCSPRLYFFSGCSIPNPFLLVSNELAAVLSQLMSMLFGRFSSCWALSNW